MNESDENKNTKLKTVSQRIVLNAVFFSNDSTMRIQNIELKKRNARLSARNKCVQ